MQCISCTEKVNFKEDRQCMYKRNTEARSCNQLQRKSSKYYIFYVCVCVALFIHHAMLMRHILICGLSASTKVVHVIL